MYLKDAVLVAIATLMTSLSLAADPPKGLTEKGQAPMMTGQPPRVVMVKVGDVEVTVKDFMGYIQKNQMLAAHAGTPTGKYKAVKSMVANMLIRDEIRETGLVPAKKLDDENAMLEGYRKLQEKFFPLPPAPPESELRAFYEKHRIDYGIPRMRRISQILIIRPQKGTDEQIKAQKDKAEDALRRLAAGEAFEKVAFDLTENTRAQEHGGDLGFVPDYAVPEQLRSLGRNQPTGLIETPKDYQILAWTDERDEMISPFEDVRARVEQRVREILQEESKDRYLAGLAQKESVVVIQEELKPLFPNGVFGKSPLQN